MRLKRYILNLGIPISIILLISIGIASVQITHHGLILGDDFSFHFNRFYETYKQITTHHINLFQSLFSFSQSGRIVNAVYGLGFSYFAGGLLALVHNWFRFQVLLSFLCEVTAGITMFALLKKINIKNWLAVCGAGLYMSSSVVSTWGLNQAMTGWGAALLPLLFTEAIAVTQDRKARFSPIVLAVGMSLLIGTHLFSTMLGFLGIIPFFLVALIRTNTKRKLLTKIGISIIITMFLSIASLLTFIDVNLSNQLIKPWKNTNMLASAVKFTMGNNSYFELGLVLTVLFLAQISYVTLSWSQRTIQERIITSVGGIFLLLSSTLVPWNFLATHSSIIAGIQFPARFQVVACILLLAGSALTAQNLTIRNPQFQYFPLISFFIMFMLIFFGTVDKMATSANYWQSSTPTAAGNNLISPAGISADRIRAIFSNSNLGIAMNTVIKWTPDYLPLKVQQSHNQINTYDLYGRQILNNPIKVTHQVTRDNKLMLSWVSDSSTTVTLPVVVYSHSIVQVNNKALRPSQISVSDIGALMVHQLHGKNQVVIGYKENNLFTKAFLIQLISWVFLIIFVGIKKINSKHRLQ